MNYERNEDILPSQIVPGSNMKVWWKCGEGHEWQATIVDRNSGKGCPYCSGRYACKGVVPSREFSQKYPFFEVLTHRTYEEVTVKELVDILVKYVITKCNLRIGRHK